MAAILGMRGTGTFSATELPTNFRQKMFQRNPNGDYPLTAILSKMKTETVDSQKTTWFAKRYQNRRMLSDGAFLAADVTISVQGNLAQTVVKGSVVLNFTKLVAGTPDWMWVDVDPSTTTAFHCVRDIQGTGGVAIANNDVLIVVGYASEQGQAMATAQSYNPDEDYNYLQEFSKTIDIPWTTSKEALRTNPSGPTPELKRDALQYLMQDIERSMIFGVRRLTTGTAGERLYFTGGIYQFLFNNAPSTNIHNFSGTVTENQFLEECKVMFRYGSTDKIMFCGSDVPFVLSQMPLLKATMNMVPTDQTYGMHLTKYIVPGGNLYIRQHPQFADLPEWRGMFLVLDLANLSFLKLRGCDIQFIANRQNNNVHKFSWEYWGTFGIRVGLYETHYMGLNMNTFIP